MIVAVGTRLGPYEVIAPLGAGGMGEVFKARDTRLDRSVAIKVLPAEFAENAQFKIRFEREAKTISQLNHPHICTLYDVGDNYLVMELLEGETLAEKLAKGPLPLDQVIRYGIEIGEALEKAHRAGVVHRDLKPGNVMITKSGAKLLDFGLAKPADGGAVGALTGLRTEKRNLTEEGTIIGTFQYMAPEQIEGAEVDARSDIFALGALLYEMATGKRAFEGKSKASLIASILTAEPQPILALQPMTPAAFDRLVRTCLRKDPDQRWQSAQDVAIELRAVPEAAPVAERPRRGLSIVVPLITALAGAAITWAAIELGKEPLRIVTSSILPPEQTEFAFDSGGAPALSPDGKRIAFVAHSASGLPMLYVRVLSGNAAQPIAGTEGAMFPFWSPDSRWIGFFSAGKLKKIESSGGPAESLADAPIPRGASWSPAGVIVFAPSLGRPLYKVSEDGGVATAVTRMDRGESNHRFPAFFADGRHFIYQVLRYGGSAMPGGTLYAGSVDGDLKRPLVEANSNGIYSRSEHLVYMREHTLVAQNFDPRTLTVKSKITPIAETVGRSRLGVALFSISNDCSLVYDSGEFFDKSHLQWFDASGKSLGDVGKLQDFRTPSFSHDQRKVAVSVLDPATSHTDIWLIDLQRGSSTRLTFGVADKFLPVWSPDDAMMLYGSSARSAGDLIVKRASGTGIEEVLYSTTDFKVPYDWSPDGKTILFQNQSPQTGWDLWLYSLAEHRARPFLQTPAQELDPKFSGDGRWIAYQSNESASNRVEVYVLPVSGSRGKWQISTDGGHSPRWSRDGKRIFYISSDSKLMSVDVSARGDEFIAGIPHALFSINPSRSPGTQYDVSIDGKRFLVNTATDASQNPPLTLVQNWAAKLTR